MTTIDISIPMSAEAQTAILAYSAAMKAQNDQESAGSQKAAAAALAAAARSLAAASGCSFDQAMQFALTHSNSA